MRVVKYFLFYFLGKINFEKNMTRFLCVCGQKIRGHPLRYLPTNKNP